MAPARVFNVQVADGRDRGCVVIVQETAATTAKPIRMGLGDPKAFNRVLRCPIEASALPSFLNAIHPLPLEAVRD